MRLNLTQLDLRGKCVFLRADFNVPLTGVVAAMYPGDRHRIRTVPAERIPLALAGFDIGPATVIRFRHALRDAGTVVWNGPMGTVERPAFASGTAFLEALEGRELPVVAALSAMTGQPVAPHHSGESVCSQARIVSGQPQAEA